jgi:hypothetical protein
MKTSKIFLTPYFGNFPEWMDKYTQHFNEQLKPKGYDWLLDTDFDGFKKRVKDKLDIEYPGQIGTGKVWDYRGSLGLLYEEEAKGYDFWGHTDFDVVYGDVDKWVTDEFLSELDVHSNHIDYVNGCWTLYRNKPEVNELFLKADWKKYMTQPEANGWIEGPYSRELEKSGLRYKYTFWQGNPYTLTPNLKLVDGKLYQDGEEIMMFHFRRSKRWPLTF